MTLEGTVPSFIYFCIFWEEGWGWLGHGRDWLSTLAGGGGVQEWV